MKKYISIILVITLMVAAFTGCGKASESTTGEKASADGKISVVTTIFPEYDWVKEIVGDNENVDITMLLDSGVDLHSFQPTADDIVKISTCDLFIYVGGESAGWVEDALAQTANKNRKVINLLDVLGDSVKEEELVEGMQGEVGHDEEDGYGEKEEQDEDEQREEEDHDEEEDHAEKENQGEEVAHDEEEPEYDEHVWLSLRNAKILCEEIADAMVEIDPEHADEYKANVTAYNEKLTELDEKYETVVREGNQKTVLFGDRFPFRYLVDDYGLDYYAAFAGCSAESEASFKTITFLAGKVDELGLLAILQIESADGSIAETIKNNTKEKNQTILTLDSMQSTTLADVESGASYLSVMEENLNVLKEALK